MTIPKADMLKTLWATVRQGKIELLKSFAGRLSLLNCVKLLDLEFQFP
ncbi:hypothetical protein [Nostoc sp. UHCC 0251]|nr:hypothetical protein [Nostoc sp. UHCC 0251]MEA5622373.1 hypothetical protein [Nostoc sp. UHCC 0251]